MTELPLILAGPILRQTTAESVTVWVAVRAVCQVTLAVFATAENGDRIGDLLLSGCRETIAIGAHLHIVAVTAMANRDGEILTADRVYAYDLTFCARDNVMEDGVYPRSLQQALAAPDLPNANISYFAHQYPTFVLPADRLTDLRIVHGSCRKPHGDGFDALPMLDRLLAASARIPSQRPQQLLFTGDQIYGDDVADPLFWVASSLSEQLLGWTEPLPSEQLTGDRAEVATDRAGFTAGLNGRHHKVVNHLFSLGEYAAIYLLGWSPACWPQTFPVGSAISPDRQAAQRWDRQVRQLTQFRDGLEQVRRALANIPLYTIFDDHEVSDDWNLNQAWCLRVLGRSLGRHVVQNALLAYAIFQGWGNTPDRFTAGTAGAKLLAAAQTWSASGGTDPTAHAEIARLVGIPQCDLAGLPKFVRDGAVSILDRDPEAIAWHYSIESNCHEILVLDTRTWRGYDLTRSPIDPPMLLSPTAFDRQLTQPLQASSPTAASRQTFIVAPTNLFSLEIIDCIHHYSLDRYAADPPPHARIFGSDVGDSWNINTRALAQLQTTLFAHRDRLVVLSGDIHAGTVARLSHHQFASNSTSTLVQLTASAFKNEEAKTRLAHTRLKDWLLAEPTRHSIGWNHPPQMLPFRRSRTSRSDIPHPHDWSCTLEWLPRHRATLPAILQRRGYANENAPQSIDRPVSAPGTSKNFQLHQWLHRLPWWNSRWFQEGREVVGLNNLAVVQFQDATIVQDLYWRSPWLPNQIVFSRFVA
ncbi:PhoD-like phosphatase [Chamaesiphon sp. VAR_69_metabat_338]|uniref:PhoD-like phosphatase n=1 Tax=Chamaesiphon sp. VAR_69_metabat_338 TaxID=2964704 RepID=UPI00286E3B13|nr:PhoD-like phosphatase [Chamaesiphon sp. VAR_69_metabat_338]